MTLFYLPLVVAGCRTVKFIKEEGVALQNHVIKTVSDSKPISCGWQCADTPLCFSMNVRRLPNGWVTYELNNSSKTADQQNFDIKSWQSIPSVSGNACYYYPWYLRDSLSDSPLSDSTV